MKKSVVILILALVSVVGMGGVDHVYGKGKAPQAKPTKEEKQRERERKVAERATAATEVKIREGKRPKYNKLLKSTNYELMYDEGLAYYNAKKVDKKTGEAGDNTSGNYQKAQNLLDRAFQSQKFAGTAREDSLMYYLGCSYYKAGIFDASEHIFDNFRRRFPYSPFIEDVEYMYAMGFYFASPAPQYDQSTTLRAMIAINEYQGRYPNTIKKTECEERMAEMRGKLHTKSFENAKLYYNIGQYKAAVRALNNAIDEYPESPYREELMYLATRSAYLFAKNSVPSQMTDRYIGMMDNYYNFISEYPSTSRLREVTRMRDEAMAHIAKTPQDDRKDEQKDITTPQEDGTEKE